MEVLLLPIFLLNIPLVMVDAALGYRLAPDLFAGMEDREVADTGVRTTRGMLSGVVALYMFFNCLGYFQTRAGSLLTVTGLVLADMALQLFIRHKMGRRLPDDGGGGE